MYFNRAFVATYSKLYEWWRVDEVARITAFQVG